MKKQITDPIFKLPHITIILFVLLMVGCGSATRSITAPELLHSVSMSPKVGVNPNQKYQKIANFSGIFLGRGKKGTNVIQEQMRQVVKGSEKRAIKDIEISIESFGGFLLIGGPAGHFGLWAEGSVIETQ